MNIIISLCMNTISFKVIYIFDSMMLLIVAFKNTCMGMPLERPPIYVI